LVEMRFGSWQDCRRSLNEEGARIAYRACLLDLASACLLVAGTLPPPDVNPRYVPGQRGRVDTLVAASMNGDG
jgi:hypothetical protein